MEKFSSDFFFFFFFFCLAFLRFIIIFINSFFSELLQRVVTWVLTTLQLMLHFTQMSIPIILHNNYHYWFPGVSFLVFDPGNNALGFSKKYKILVFLIHFYEKFRNGIHLIDFYDTWFVQEICFLLYLPYYTATIIIDLQAYRFYCVIQKSIALDFGIKY